MDHKTAILVVEDEPRIRTGLRDFLEFHDYRVSAAADGLEAARLVQEGHFDLILLDLMLPHVSGDELCRKWRQAGVQTPIIMLTAKGQEKDKINGLNEGADDYITKPFSLEELHARIRAVLRRLRPGRSVGQTFRFGPWQVDIPRLRISAGKTAEAISPREGQIVQYLAENAGRIISREELYQQVWGEPWSELGTRTVDMHIAKLRGKIEKDTGNPEIIRTVRGAGYIYGD